MNRQETYDKVRDHLMNQGERSFLEGAGCQYRGPGGMSCAVGCLIPDSIYKPDIESTFADDLPGNVLWAIGARTKDDATFLRRLQQIHDIHRVEDWPDRLYNFAVENGLRP